MAAATLQSRQFFPSPSVRLGRRQSSAPLSSYAVRGPPSPRHLSRAARLSRSTCCGQSAPERRSGACVPVTKSTQLHLAADQSANKSIGEAPVLIPVIGKTKKSNNVAIKYIMHLSYFRVNIIYLPPYTFRDLCITRVYYTRSTCIHVHVICPHTRLSSRGVSSPRLDELYSSPPSLPMLHAPVLLHER